MYIHVCICILAPTATESSSVAIYSLALRIVMQRVTNRHSPISSLYRDGNALFLSEDCSLNSHVFSVT